jgi:hypothetical protein
MLAQYQQQKPMPAQYQQQKPISTQYQQQNINPFMKNIQREKPQYEIPGYTQPKPSNQEYKKSSQNNLITDERICYFLINTVKEVIHNMPETGSGRSTQRKNEYEKILNYKLDAFYTINAIHKDFLLKHILDDIVMKNNLY